jgi:hypothetical protein
VVQFGNLGSFAEELLVHERALDKIDRQAETRRARVGPHRA